MATLTHPKGRTVIVPDETVDYYTSKGWSVAGEKPAKESTSTKSDGGPVVIPEGDPSKDWTNPQLDAYAEREGLDFAGVKNKGDRLKAIAEGRNVQADGDAGSPDDSGTSADAGDGDAGETGE